MENKAKTAVCTKPNFGSGLTSSNAEPAKRQREIVNNEKKIDHFKRKASDSRYLPVPTIASIIEDANKIGDGTFSGY